MRLDAWLTIWGVGLAFAVQIVYDALGTWLPSLRIYLGLIAVFALVVMLAFFKPSRTDATK